jgi:hypothetical protein
MFVNFTRKVKPGIETTSFSLLLPERAENRQRLKLWPKAFNMSKKKKLAAARSEQQFDQQHSSNCRAPRSVHLVFT